MTDRKQIALAMLQAGHASPAEIARLLNASTQLVNYWRGGFNWQPAREAFLAKLLEHWQTTIPGTDSPNAPRPPSAQSTDVAPR